jgi:hypothetical protein
VPAASLAAGELPGGGGVCHAAGVHQRQVKLIYLNPVLEEKLFQRDYTIIVRPPISPRTDI